MRPVRALILAIVAVATVAQPATPISARGATGQPALVIDAISPFAGPSFPLTLSADVINGGSTPITRATLRITIHDRVITRTELRQALDGDARGVVIAVTTEELGEPIGPSQRRQVAITRNLTSLSNTFSRGSGDGVYPLTISLLSEGVILQERTTAIPYLSSEPKSRLNLAVVVPLHRPATFDATGAYPVGGFERDVARSGALGTVIDVIGKHEPSALTLAPDGLTLDQMSDIAQGFRSRDANGYHDVPPTDARAVAATETLALLRHIASAPAFEIATVPYARADLVGLAGHQMGADVARQLALGAARNTQLLGREPNPRVIVPGGYALDARSAALVAPGQDSPIVIIGPESLPERQSRFGYDRPEKISGGAGTTLTALVVDPAIRDRLSTEQSPALKAQGALAETAASYFELPALAAERMLVVAPLLTPDAATLSRLLDAFDAAPWVRIIKASDAAGSLPPTEEPIQLQIVTPSDRAPLVAARGARRTLTLLSKVLGEQTTVERLERFLLAAEAEDYLRDDTRGAILARAARGAAERLLAMIRVPGRVVTLTSQQAQVPVTLLNDTGLPARVQIRLVSAKIAFPEGNSIDIDATQSVTTFTVRAQTKVAGSFPLRVEIRTPDGNDLVGEGDIVVRSTAVSGVTLAVTGGGVAMLFGSWFRRLRRERKQRP